MPFCASVFVQLKTLKIGLVQRFVGLTIGIAVVYGLYSVAPETGGAVANLNRAHDSILDLFNLKDGPKSLGGGANATGNLTANVTNGTETPLVEQNTTAQEDVNATNATVIPSLDEILAEVGEEDDEDAEQPTEAPTREEL